MMRRKRGTRGGGSGRPIAQGIVAAIAGTGLMTAYRYAVARLRGQSTHLRVPLTRAETPGHVAKELDEVSGAARYQTKKRVPFMTNPLDRAEGMTWGGLYVAGPSHRPRSPAASGPGPAPGSTRSLASASRSSSSRSRTRAERLVLTLERAPTGRPPDRIVAAPAATGDALAEIWLEPLHGRWHRTRDCPVLAGQHEPDVHLTDAANTARPCTICSRSVASGPVGQPLS